MEILKIVILLVLVGSQLFVSSASAASIRFACFGLGDEAESFKVFTSDEEFTEIDVPRVGFSQPVDLDSRMLKLDSTELLPSTLPVEKSQLMSISLPDQGDAFIILLMDVEQSGIRPLVIPADSKDFKAGDLMFFNLSDSPVVVKLGDSEVRLKPYSKQFKSPPKMPSGGSYQVQFLRDKGGKAKMFGATRWKYEPNLRGYIFILQHASTGRFYYQSMGESVQVGDE